MKLFSFGPSAREQFALAALAAAGVDESAFAVALEARNPNFLRDALESATADPVAAQHLQTVTARLSALEAGLLAAGLNADLVAGDATHLEKTLAERASRTAAETLAGHGIPPLKAGSPPDGPSAAAELSLVEFKSLSPAERLAFCKRNGRLTE